MNLAERLEDLEMTLIVTPFDGETGVIRIWPMELLSSEVEVVALSSTLGSFELSVHMGPEETIWSRMLVIVSKVCAHLKIHHTAGIAGGSWSTVSLEMPDYQSEEGHTIRVTANSDDSMATLYVSAQSDAFQVQTISDDLLGLDAPTVLSELFCRMFLNQTWQTRQILQTR